jgi:hypothetical protein
MGEDMIDLNTCNFVVYGFRNSYNTFGHIQEAWYRALQYKFPDRKVSWVDEMNVEDADFSNAVVMTVNVANLVKMPKRKDAFYIIHNLDETTKAAFGGDLRQYSVMNYGMYTSTTKLGQDDIEVGFETYLSLQGHEAYTTTILRWGTDLFPHEIEANKPTQVFDESKTDVNFVGTIYHNVHDPFAKACRENGIKFNAIGGFTGTAPVSIAENVRLVRESYMAPAIGDVYHAKVGYIPCRTYKNISYGRLPLTNNRYAQEFFKGRLIFNEDTYQLFYDAKKALREYKLADLHQLMDEVAANHTYLTKVDSLLKAVKLTQEARG